MASLIVAIVAVIVSVVSVTVAVKARSDSKKSAEVATAQRHDQLAPRPQWQWKIKNGGTLYLYDNEEFEHSYRVVSNPVIRASRTPQNPIRPNFKLGPTSI